MSEEYRDMWKDLGLNLESHDELLSVLGKAYSDFFLTQNNRPNSTKYLDFVISEIHGLRIKELVEAKKNGRKIIGTYCTFVPEEIVIATDAIMVGLCAGADFNIEEVEKILPRNTCALIKSTFGFKTGKVCPYLEVSDVVVGENTCDGKKKAYELFKPMVNDLYIMDLPQTKGETARKFLRHEYMAFLKKMETLTGKTISTEKLKDAITIVNNKRQALHRLAKLRQASPSPISGLDSLLINQISFFEDPLRFTDQINLLCEELEQRVASGDGISASNTPRILVSGCPMAAPNWKLPVIIETSGAVIVGEESCVGERGNRNLVKDNGNTVDELIDSIVDRYLKIDCAIFSPNEDRLGNITDMVNKYNADGVLLYGLQFCTPYAMEAMSIEPQLEAIGIPVLKVETDYSMEDMGQIKTRFEAFVEILQDNLVSA